MNPMKMWRQHRAWDVVAVGLVCVMALAAVILTTSVVVGRLRAQRSSASTEQLAPGLGALSDNQLAELLPRASDFPSSWRIKPETLYDRFGYVRQQTFRATFSRPAECDNLNESAVGDVGGAQVDARNPAAPAGYASDPKDVRLALGREYDRNGFDAVISLASRCSRFTLGGTLTKTVRILENSRPGGSVQRFRLSVTMTGFGIASETEYMYFARTAGLILTGWASTGHQLILDPLFDDCLRRISAG